MPDASSLNFLGVLAISFAPMFACAVFLRARGLMGFLAIIGILAVGAFIFVSFEGWRLTLAFVAGLGGLTLGGYVSDTRERQRLRRLDLEAAERKEAMLRKQYSRKD